MASGDVVNTAARLQAAAPVDGILVDETTMRATDRVIEFEPVEPVAAKGKVEPVAAWRAVGARASLGVDVAQAPRTPLVGRERELGLLEDALARVRDEHAVQLVTLVGVPGMGKTRLVWELLQTVEAEPELTIWRQGRCLPYGQGWRCGRWARWSRPRPASWKPTRLRRPPPRWPGRHRPVQRRGGGGLGRRTPAAAGWPGRRGRVGW